METYKPNFLTPRWFKEIAWKHLVALLFVFFSLYPIVYVLSNSVSTYANLSGSRLIPSQFSLMHYDSLFNEPLYPFLRWLYNTYKIATIAAFLNVMLASFAAYAFSRMQFKGRRVGLITLVLVQMFPAFLAFIALYLLLFEIGDVFPAIGLGTQAGLILVYLGGAVGFNSWLIKGYMDTIPPSIDESAKIDGATINQIYFRILFPLVRPILIVVFVISFIGIYGDYIMASIFLKDKDLITVAVGINTAFVRGYGGFNSNWGAIAASSVLAAAPIAFLFLYFQKQITGGLTAGSVKG